MRSWILPAMVFCLNLLPAISPARATDPASTDDAVELVLTPRAIEQPLLKHRLFPAEYELKDGNAATIILRMPWDQQPYMSEIAPKLDEYLEIRLDDPRILKNGTVHFDHFYQQLRRAAYRRTADWNYPIDEEPAAFILLPDVQGSRQFVGKGLSIWIRHSIAKGDLDRAREGILVGLAVSRHYARTPYAVVQHVSNSINSQMFDRLEELVSRPGCPNFYWALSALPSPLLDMRPTLENEMLTFERTQRGVEHLDLETAVLPRNLRGDELQNLDRAYTVPEWDQIANAMICLLYAVEESIKEPTLEVRNELISKFAARGRTELPLMRDFRDRDVASMSDSEAGVRWFMARYHEDSQRIAAYSMLSPREAIPLLRNLQDEPSKLWRELGLERRFVLGVPLNQYVLLKRGEQRVAVLRTVEAIRHYAALHDGRLPESLSDIRDLPVPDNPLLGEPFQYSVKDGVATLSSNPIVVQSNPGVPNVKRGFGRVHYRIRLRQE